MFRKLKVALVQPPLWSVMTPPYHLGLLTAVLKKAGYKVSCHDINVKLYNYSQKQKDENKWEILEATKIWNDRNGVLGMLRRYEPYVNELIEEILRSNPDVIGFSTTFVSRMFAEELARKIKEKRKDVIIVFGGFVCFRCELGLVVLDCPYVDAVCFLEGEKPFVNLLKAIKKNRGKIASCRGFGVRTSEGHVIDCGDYPLIEDLNSLPFPDYSELDLGEYPEKILPLMASRGCVNRCAYCIERLAFGSFRGQNAERVFREILHLHKRHPDFKRYYFNDSMINSNMKMLNRLCELIIDKKLDITWGSNLGVNPGMTFSFLEKMKRAGCYLVCLGLESGSPKVLKLMHKNYSLDVAEEMIKNMKSLGIRVHANFVVGFPGETEEDVDLTIKFLERIIDYLENVNFHPCVILPGTYVDQHKEEYGVVIPKNNDKIRWYTSDGKNNFEIRQKRLTRYGKVLGKRAHLGKI